MPIYTYQDKKTKKVFDVEMSIAEMEEYETNNPNHLRVYNQVNIVDPAGIGVSKPPADFTKYVLGKVKAANPHNAVGTGRWDIKKEI